MATKKRILLVTSAFDPDISPRSFRATELAKEFCRRGEDVTIITKHRNHDYSGFLNKYNINLKMWRKQRFPVIPIFKKEPFRFISRAFSRLMLLLFEYPDIEELFLVRKAVKNERGYDLMISFAVPFPVQWGVSSIWNKKKPIAKTWVADCGDPFMLNKIPTFRKPFYFKYLEKSFCRKCSYLSVPYESLVQKFYPEFEKKIVVIPQGFDFNAIDVAVNPRKNETPTFIFAGSIIPGKRDLSLFLDYLSTLEMEFLFIVYTNQKDWFLEYKALLKEKLEIRDYIDRVTLICEMSKVDFLVNVDTIYDRKSNIEALPSKLIDYALSGRPILNINSEVLDKEMINSFMNRDYSRQRVIDTTKYDIRKVADRFLDLLR